MSKKRKKSNTFINDDTWHKIPISLYYNPISKKIRLYDQEIDLSKYEQRVNDPYTYPSIVNIIPDHIWIHHILRYIDRQDIYNLRITCSTIYKILNDGGFIKQLIPYERLNEYKKTIKKCRSELQQTKIYGVYVQLSSTKCNEKMFTSLPIGISYLNISRVKVTKFDEKHTICSAMNLHFPKYLKTLAVNHQIIWNDGDVDDLNASMLINCGLEFANISIVLEEDKEDIVEYLDRHTWKNFFSETLKPRFINYAINNKRKYNISQKLFSKSESSVWWFNQLCEEDMDGFKKEYNELLLFAIRCNFVNIVKTLLQLGCDPFYKNDNGKNAYDIAYDVQNNTVTDILNLLPKQ